ncbi:hypothetical protein [Pseudomonas sp. SWRI154]|uniref:hypothetical protein n=1 Tax=Pseudomonas sp. SWRI154 TaxID=2745501 RepID=UPI001645C481|nr:hypothetical protein [Pseudomonas sp. SWRI154]MBC3362644.1 hypothetical protein [Pseudomonas sp. SWRI154]
MFSKKNIRAVIGSLPLSLQFCAMRLMLCFESILQRLRISQLKRMGMREFSIPVSAYNETLECHILGSGWSLNHSYESIDRKKSFVIGFNFSFLKCSNPDLHFIENASAKNMIFFMNTFQVFFGMKKFRVLEESKVVFKNVSELKNSVKLIGMLYSEKAYFIRDKHYRIFGKRAVKSIVQQMCGETKVLPQAISSIIGLAVLAKTMGFKKIVIHGLDFKGPHFYGADASDMIFNEALLPHVSVDAEGFEPHKTAVGENGVGVVSVMQELKSEFEKCGVNILAASKLSPSAEILGWNEPK